MVFLTESRHSAVLGASITAGIISVIGSTTIIVVLLRSPKRLQSIYRRLVFGMSCMDILHSLSYIAGGLPAPKETAGWWSRNAIGNIATCNIQGFANYAGMIGSVFYSCALALYFVMVVVYSKREDVIQKKIEPFFHAISTLVPFGAGIFLLVTQHFNDASTICWIARSPFDCYKEDIACKRGENAALYRWYFAGFPLLLVVLIVLGCMLRLSWSIRKQLKKMKKYGANKFVANVEKKRRNSIILTSGTNLHSKKIRMSKPSKSKEETKQMLTQAMLYVMALLITFFFAFLWQIVKTYFWLYLLEVTFTPLLGFFNFFIFIRPRVIMTMQNRPELSFFQAFYTAITAKEIISPSGRRGSMMMTARKSCAQTLTRRKGSAMSSDAILAAVAKIAQEEDDERDLEHGLEGTENDLPPNSICGLEVMESASPLYSITNLEGMEESDSPLNTVCGLEEMCSDPKPKSSEAQGINDAANATDDVDGTFNMTKDYTNML